MQNWKKAVIFGSIGAGAVLLMAKRRPAGMALAAAGLAVLASEYPEKFEANVELGYDNDYREYKLPAEMLRQLGVSEVRLISNNPDKVAALERAGISVVERISAEVEPYESSENYLRTKKEKMGHLFNGW